MTKRVAGVIAAVVVTIAMVVGAALSFGGSDFAGQDYPPAAGVKDGK